MRLNRLELTRYGKFTDKRLDFGSARAGATDFHLVYGPNEAGKSTLFSAYLDLLFGIEAQSAYGFLHPYPTMRIGADITIGAEHHAVARLKRRQGSLVAPDDRVLPDALFAAVLGGVDRQTYQMMFSLDDDSIERGGESILKSEGELGALLFSASSGLSGIGAGLDRLKAEADAFFRPQARKHELKALKDEIEVLREQRRDLDVAARDYGTLTRQLEASSKRYDDAFDGRAATWVLIEGLERRLGAMPLLERLRASRAKLAAFEPGEAPPREWTGLVNQLMREEAELAAGADRLAAERERRNAALKDLPSDPAVLDVGAEIAALAGSPLEARYQTAEMDLSGRVSERARIDEEIAGKQARIALPAGTDAADLVLPADRIAALTALVAARSGLTERLAAARREEEEAARAHGLAAARVTAVGEDDGDHDAEQSRQRLAALVRAAKASAQATRLRDFERDVHVAQAALSASLERIGWHGTVESLRALDAPGRGTVDALRTAVRRNADFVAKTDDQVRSLTQDVAGLNANLDRMRRSEPLVGDDEAHDLRLARDAAWKEHRMSLDAATAERFEAALRQDDEAAGQRLAQAERLSQMRLSERALADKQARLDALGDDLGSAGAEGRLLLDQIEGMAMRLGISLHRGGTVSGGRVGGGRPRMAVAASLGAAAVAPSGRDDPAAGPDDEPVAAWLADALAGLDVIEGWVSQRIEALSDDEVLSARRAALDFAEQEATGLARRLASALDRPEPSDVSAAILDELLLAADDHAAMLGERITGRRSATQALAAADAQRDERQRGREQAEAAMGEWNVAWETACRDTWLASSGIATDAARAGALLPLIHEITGLVDARRELDRRIDGMRRDKDDFTRRAVALGEKLGETPSGGAGGPLAVMRRLSERLQLARGMLARGESLHAELERLDKDAMELADRRAVFDRQVREICGALGCQTLAEASFALEKRREREEMRRRVDETAFDLARAMLTGTAEEAEAELATTDEAELLAELGRLRSAHDDQDAEVREAHTARTKAADALAAIGADGAVAAIEERRRTLILDLADRAQRYLAARAGILAAEAALRLYRERHRSAMMQHASEAFRTISGGEYAGLSTVVEKDTEILVASAATGGSKLARELSKGTRFQLYLALRVAGYHEIAANREILPFVADDIMETFDDNRSLNTFRLMAEMAKVGQVIYLTHHQHLRDIARQACPGVVVHEL